jgi:hypothetical protein
LKGHSVLDLSRRQEGLAPMQSVLGLIGRQHGSRRLPHCPAGRARAFQPHRSLRGRRQPQLFFLLRTAPTSNSSDPGI